MTYVYDHADNLVSKTEARGITTAYSYDALNRLTGKTYSDGTPAVTYSHDTGVANGIGRLTQVANANSIANYSAYDELGRVKQSNQQTLGQTYGFSYSYNRGGAVISETYPSGRTISTSYDRVNRPSAVSGVLNAQTRNYVSNVSYWPHGALNGFLYGNGITPGYAYNSRLQMSQMAAALGAGSSQYLSVLNYDWGTTDNNGNLHSEAMLNWNAVPYAPLNSFTQTFTYDGLNRLSHAADTGGWSRDFNYDRYGNMWVTNATGIAATGATAQGNYEVGSNRMYGLGYDLAGNQLTANGDTLGYDAENRQVTVTEPPSLGGGTEYIAYDGDGKRVAKSGPAGTTVYVYDVLGQLAAEYATVAGPTPCHTCYLTWDHLGSTRLVTDENGAAVAQHDFLPFGEEIAAGSAARGAQWGSGNDAVNQKFTAKERDAESGLDYFGARYYGSALGRFTSPDPYNILTRKDQGKTQAERKSLLDSFISNPQSWNKYAYALNAPLHLVDAGGNCSAPAGLKPGQTGVCIEAFIAAPRIGGVGLGDNRTFSSSGGTYRFRVDVRVDPGANGNISINKDAAMSQIGTSSINIGLRGKGEAQIGAVIPDDQGNRQFAVTGQAINGIQRFTGLGPQGAIQFDLSFTATPGGSVSLDMAQGTTYPSLEIYTYDSNGKLTGTLLKSPEQQPSDLQRPMACLGGKDCPN